MDFIREIKHKAMQYKKYTTENLSKIVQIPSLSGEEEAVIQELKRLCEEAKFDEVFIDGLGNLIGRVGQGSRKIAIDAHIDTVDTGDKSQWNRNPFSGEISEGFVHGRGTVDQKGGAAAMITSGKILKELSKKSDFSIYYTFTIMEEDCDGLCWNYIIEKENLVPECAIITEPTNLAIYRGHRGRMEMELYFKGLSAHGSAPERGRNAAYMAARAALAIENLQEKGLPTDPFLGRGSVAVTMIQSRTPSLCAIPDSAKIHIDRRLSWGESCEKSVEEIETAINMTGQVRIPEYEKMSYKGTLFAQQKYFPTWKIEETHDLVQAGIKTYQELFQKDPEIGKWIFSTNGVALCGKHQIPCIGFGPGNEVYAHAPNEAIPIDHLEVASAFYASLPFFL